MPDSQVDVSKARVLLAKIKSNGKDLSRPMREISMMLENSVKENFDVGGRYSEKGSPMGGPKKWPELKYPKKQGSILCRSGILQRSLIGSSDGTSAKVTTNIVYAAIQNFGGKTRAHKIAGRNSAKKCLKFSLTGGGKMMFRKSVNHPGSDIDARPFMVAQPDDIKEAKEIIAEHLTDGVQK